MDLNAQSNIQYKFQACLGINSTIFIKKKTITIYAAFVMSCENHM